MPLHRTAVAFALTAAWAGFAAPTGTTAPLKPDPAAATRRMEALWVDLEKGNAEASRALLKLADHPKETVVFLRDKVTPLKVSPERVRELLGDLGSEDEKTWKKAFEELGYYDPRLAIDLATLMTDVTESPTRQRMVAVLSGRNPKDLEGKTVSVRPVGNEGFNFFDGSGSWWAEHRVDRLNAGWLNGGMKKWTRATRAVILLEHIGTPEAVDILKNMATGHPDAHPTKEAKAAVERLAAQPR